MKARFVKSRSVLIGVALAWAGAIVALHLTYVRPSLARQTDQIERESAAEWLRLANSFLMMRRAQMLRLMEDCSHSREIGQYLSGGDARLIPWQAQLRSLESARIASVLLCDRDGKLVSSWATEEGGGLAPDHSVAAGLDLSKLHLLDSTDLAEEFSGVGNTPLGLALFAQCPVYSPGGGQRIGYVVCLCPADERLFAELSAVVGTTVSLRSTPQLPPGELLPTFGQAVWRGDDDQLKGVQVFRDAAGRPTGYLTVEGEARANYRHTRTVERALTITLLWATGFSLLMILVIHVVVSGPTAKLVQRVQRLRAGDAGVRLSEGLRGEARALARQFEEVLGDIEKVSQTDALTGVCNRRFFRQSFVRQYRLARRYERPMALAVMDIDYLKAANDVLGHQMGDAILQICARLVQENVRATDTVARVGGDEFAILMPETTSANAAAVCERIRTCVACETVGRDQVRLSPTVSMGVCDLNAPGVDSPEALYNLADKAMYTAKRAGRNRTVQAEQLEEVSALAAANDRAKVEALCKQMAGLDVPFKRMFVESLGAFVSALEARDVHTVNHSAKVRACALMIARQMKLPSRTIERIGRAAMLLDVGKIGLPDSVLLKKGLLSQQEWELVKRHSLLSVRIMEGLGFLDQEIPAVRCHHERYDGTGYPEGLAGSAIPVEARILGVADAFTAMTSSRVYRPSLSVAEALAEIRRGSGTQFDPAVVEAFLQLAEKENLAEEAAGIAGPPSA